MTEEDYKKIIARNIRKYREERGWSQKELALRLGDERQTRVSNWEKGTSSLGASRLFALCDVLGVTPTDMGRSSDIREGLYVTDADEVDLVSGYRMASSDDRDTMLYKARRAILNKRGALETSALSGVAD